MKFTYNWLLRFLETKSSSEEIAEKLVEIGLEVDSMVDMAKNLSGFRVAYIEEANPHPNADKLRVCKVMTSEDSENGPVYRQVVCGAPNARAGIKVVLADIGAIVPNGGFAIKASKIRDVDSFGMLCSYDELMVDGSGEVSDGIIELSMDAKIGDNVAHYLGCDDVIYDVEVTPNRGDWLGVQGIARDLAAKGLGKLIDEELNQGGAPSIHGSFKSKFTAKTESPECSLLALAEIRGVKNGPSPAWLAKLLKNIGMEPVSLIVDITNYFSVSYARPLHAYDSAKIQGGLISRNIDSGDESTDNSGAESANPFLALNGKEYKLGSGDLVISDEEKIVSLAGVIGGDNSKCEASTHAIILESAAFDKVAVTKLGRKHSIITDARSRFERGVDDGRTIEMLNRASDMILRLGSLDASSSNGERAEVSEVFFSGSHKEPEIMEFDPKIIERRIGIYVDHEEVVRILTSLGFIVSGAKDGLLSVKIPTWRHDINCPEVIGEEVVRIIGYDKITPSNFAISPILTSRLTREQKRLNELRRKVASLGYDEVVTWSFMDSKKASYFGGVTPDMYLLNPISVEFNYMRPSIIPNLLGIIASNAGRSIPNVAVFESGPVFYVLDKEVSVITSARSGEIARQGHASKSRNVDIFDIKADLEAVLSEAGMNLSSLKLEASAPSYYHPGRSGSYSLGKNVVAYFGEIHPEVQEIYGLKNSACCFEIFSENIPLGRAKAGRRTGVLLSPYQPVTRDLAYVFDESLKAGDILKLMQSCDKLVKSAEIFDIYMGPGVEEGKKSVAFRFVVQSDDATLTDAQIAEVVGKLKNICEKAGGVMRG